MLTVGKIKFQMELTKILSQAAQKAFESTVVSAGNAGVDAEASMEIKKTASKFGQTFAKEAASDMADAIMEFIKSADINIIYTPTTLVSPTGPVTGVLTMTPMTSQIKIL